jgi:Leucine-rich repeat (LRR) protein
MHDLYKAYAEWYVTGGDGSKYVWCVYEGPPTNVFKGKLLTQKRSSSNVSSIQNKKIRRSPPSTCWEDLMRICIFGWKGSLSRTKILEWRNVEVLQLYFSFDVKELNLSGLFSLRHLELIGLENLVMLTFSNAVVEDGSWPKPRRTTSTEELGHPTSLISLSLSQCSSLTSLPKEIENMFSLTTLDVSQCVSLTTLPRGLFTRRSGKLTTLNIFKCRTFPWVMQHLDFDNQVCTLLGMQNQLQLIV